MKLPNGYGSVYKLSGNRRRPWIARVTTGWTPEGKQLYRTLGYYKTKKDGMAALAMYHQKGLSPKAGMTLKEVYEEWSETRFKNISKATINSYKASWKYLQKYENEKFRELRTAQLQRIINDNSHMSMSTLSKIKALATSLYDYAMANDIVDKNYAQFIELPKKESKEKRTFTREEIEIMFDEADSIPWLDTVLILIYTGMRVSEMLKLPKSNIDLENKLIVGGIKTDAGKDRVIPIHPRIYKYVETWYNKLGELLITYEDGSSVSVSNYRRRRYYPALEAAGVRMLTPHECRHTFGSMLSDVDANTVAIQKMMGHTDYAFTANQYTHKDIEELRKELNKIK